MSNAVFARTAFLALAIGWTAFAGMRAGEVGVWPSAFIGSLAGLGAFFWLASIEAVGLAPTALTEPQAEERKTLQAILIRF